MVALSRTHYRPLLSTVKGKPHASSDDHDEPVRLPKDSASKAPRTVSSAISVEVRRTPRKPKDSEPEVHDLTSGVVGEKLNPLELAKTSPQKRKAAEPEVLDLTESGAFKKQKKDTAPSRVQKSKAEQSLPSPASIESGKRRGTTTMQTGMDTDADPLSSSEAEQPSTVSGAQKNGNGSTS